LLSPHLQLRFSTTLRANLEVRRDTSRDEKPLHKKLNNYSNYFSMDFLS
jgi:hypothetical protein